MNKSSSHIGIVVLHSICKTLSSQLHHLFLGLLHGLSLDCHSINSLTIFEDDIHLTWVQLLCKGDFLLHYQANFFSRSETSMEASDKIASAHTTLVVD